MFVIYLKNRIFGQLQHFQSISVRDSWFQMLIKHLLMFISPCLCVVRGQQYIAQTPASASVFYAPGRLEHWQQFRLWPHVQSPQLLQLLRHLYEPLSFQQPHERCRQWALSTGQSNGSWVFDLPLWAVFAFCSPLLTLYFPSCNCIWVKLNLWKTHVQQNNLRCGLLCSSSKALDLFLLF